MNAILIAVAGMAILLLLVYLASKKVSSYEDEVKKEYLSLGVLSLGKVANTDVPIVEIKTYLKLTNTF